MFQQIRLMDAREKLRPNGMLLRAKYKLLIFRRVLTGWINMFGDDVTCVGGRVLLHGHILYLSPLKKMVNARRARQNFIWFVSHWRDIITLENARQEYGS